MIFNKVKFYDKLIINKFLKIIGFMSSIATIILIFFEIPKEYKYCSGIAFTAFLILIYFIIWYRANNLEDIKITIEGSDIVIKVGDIFEQKGLKTIAFNEYFDTQVDDKIISKRSLNGIFIEKYFKNQINKLDKYIEEYDFENNTLEISKDRKDGKKQKYKLGTICLYQENCINDDGFILVAFSKFDQDNKAGLTMPQYLEFLIKFWDEINRVYGQRCVSVTIFGSGITRIKEHKNISDEELLQIMLWTFRISGMRFKYPAKLIIVIHKDKIDKINLFNIESDKNGLY